MGWISNDRDGRTTEPRLPQVDPALTGGESLSNLARMRFFSAGERASMRILRRIAVASVLLVALLCLPTFLSSLPTARGSSGGPDSYGYTWTDSKPVPGVSYGWVDGLSGGTDLLLADDDCTQTRTSFTFSFKF